MQYGGGLSAVPWGAIMQYSGGCGVRWRKSILEKYMVKFLCMTQKCDCSYVGVDLLFDQRRSLSLHTDCKKESIFAFACDVTSD